MRSLLLITATILAVSLVPTAESRARTRTVELAGEAFSPTSVRIHVGQRVRFVWVDGLHNVTRKSGPAFATIDDRDGGRVVRAFRKTGRYVLVCTNHEPGMRLVVRVVK